MLSFAVTFAIAVAVAVCAFLDRAGDLSGTLFDFRLQAGEQECGVIQQEEGVYVFAYDASGLVSVLPAQGLGVRFGIAWQRPRPSAENGVISPESPEVSDDEFTGQDRRSGGWRLSEESFVGSDQAVLPPAAPSSRVPAETEPPLRYVQGRRFLIRLTELTREAIRE